MNKVAATIGAIGGSIAIIVIALAIIGGGTSSFMENVETGRETVNSEVTQKLVDKGSQVIQDFKDHETEAEFNEQRPVISKIQVLVEKGQAITSQEYNELKSLIESLEQESENNIQTPSSGASITLDKKSYSNTDKVLITITAMEHNLDSDLIDEIGNTDNNPVKISTKDFALDNYKLVETGPNTGIFTGEIMLVGYGTASTQGDGPTDGVLESSRDIQLTFESFDEFRIFYPRKNSVDFLKNIVFFMKFCSI